MLLRRARAVRPGAGAAVVRWSTIIMLAEAPSQDQAPPVAAATLPLPDVAAWVVKPVAVFVL